ncbi:MAG: 2-C-methyl-D-erythritol 4-phosphate cytidylyltransferase [Deltaproteobacteria bacterium]|nr:2-C-methyl-D-erythritol 4-phosphate cytidylyltransferase [Deltaproteobacteria bacterium]
MNVTAIVPAAGTGRRMGEGEKKPYILLLGKPILIRTLEVLAGLAAIRHIVIPVFPGEEQRCRDELGGYLTPAVRVSVTAGGQTRQESVGKALALVEDNTELVLVHDGARPLVPAELIEQALEQAQRLGAATLGVPVKDTTVRVAGTDMQITETLPRRQLYAVQTPQVFKRELIVKAHRSARQEGFSGTDDASLVQRLGNAVTIVPGTYDNIKITTPEDLLIAESILRRRTRKNIE